MWLLMLEAALALALLIFIVWWTMGPVKKREDRDRAARAANDAGESGAPKD